MPRSTGSGEVLSVKLVDSHCLRQEGLRAGKTDSTVDKEHYKSKDNTTYQEYKWKVLILNDIAM